jgi:hypothetical protein
MPDAAVSSRDPAMSPYRAVLGDRFEELAPILRSFHADGGEARGQFDVQAGDGAVRRGLARFFRLPQPGAAQPVRLEVAVSGARQQWRRTIGRCRFHSVQWAERALLVERVGVFRFCFRLSVTDGSLRFEQCSATLLGIPLPRFASPFVTAIVNATGPTRWHVRVEIACGALGIITHYSGIMELA